MNRNVARINRGSVKIEPNGTLIREGVECSTMNVSFIIDVPGVIKGVEQILHSIEWGVTYYSRVKGEAIFRELDMDSFLDEILEEKE